MGWVVNATSRPLYPRERDPLPIKQEVGWAERQVWTGMESVAPTGIRSPDRPARSVSLYRLRSPRPSWIKVLSNNLNLSQSCCVCKLITPWSEVLLVNIKLVQTAKPFLSCTEPENLLPWSWGQLHETHVPTSHISKLGFNNILPSMPRSSKLSLLLWFFN